MNISGNRWPCCNAKTGLKDATLGLHDVWQGAVCPFCNRRWRLRITVSEYLTKRMGGTVLRIEWKDPKEVIRDGAA